MLAYGPGVLAELRQSFVESGFSVRKLMVNIVTITASHGLPESSSVKTASN